MYGSSSRGPRSQRAFTRKRPSSDCTLCANDELWTVGAYWAYRPCVVWARRDTFILLVVSYTMNRSSLAILDPGSLTSS
jgi:hypothetical protein